MSDGDSQERRKYPRYPVSLNVAFVFARGREQRPDDQRISGKGRNISGRTGDISFEGLLVKANPLHADVSSLFLDTQAARPMFVGNLEIELDLFGRFKIDLIPKDTLTFDLSASVLLEPDIEILLSIHGPIWKDAQQVLVLD